MVKKLFNWSARVTVVACLLFGIASLSALEFIQAISFLFLIAGLLGMFASLMVAGSNWYEKVRDASSIYGKPGKRR